MKVLRSCEHVCCKRKHVHHVLDSVALTGQMNSPAAGALHRLLRDHGFDFLQIHMLIKHCGDELRIHIM